MGTCKNCQHWGLPHYDWGLPHYVGDQPDWNWCENPESGMVGGEGIETHRDFGCNQFEKATKERKAERKQARAAVDAKTLAKMLEAEAWERLHPTWPTKTYDVGGVPIYAAGNSMGRFSELQIVELFGEQNAESIP